MAMPAYHATSPHLHAAARSGDLCQARALLEHGADPNEVDGIDGARL